MSFEKYILEVKALNSEIFKAEKITITPASLEKSLERAFYAGLKHYEDLMKEELEKHNQMNYLFGNIFGDMSKGKNEE